MREEFASGLLSQAVFDSFQTLDSESVAEIIQTFLNESQTAMDELESYIANSNLQSQYAVVHRMKGSSGLAGAAKMHEILVGMQHIYHQAELTEVDLAALKGYFSELKSVWKKTYEAMKSVYQL